MNKIKQTSSDKIRGKVVKHGLGDCLIIKAGRKYLGVIVTGKFNKYYNFTLMDFVLTAKPTIKDFLEGRFFGTRSGSLEDLEYLTDQRMIECKYVDNEIRIAKVGSLHLTIDYFDSASYSYVDDIDHVLKYFKEELPIRIEKTKDAERFLDLGFHGRHLIPTEKIVAR